MIGLSSQLKRDNLDTLYSLHTVYTQITVDNFNSRDLSDQVADLLSGSYPGKSGESLNRLYESTMSSFKQYEQGRTGEEKEQKTLEIRQSLDNLILQYRNIIDYRDEVVLVFINFLIIAIIVQSLIFFLSLRHNLIEQTIVREKEQHLLLLQKMQERERQDLAAFLHDRVLQDLGEINLTLAEGQAQSKMKKSIANIRSITYSLVPVHLEQTGLEGSLKDLGNQLFSHSPCHFKLYSYGYKENYLSAEVKLIYYRFFQEALTNSKKYSKANQVRVSLTGLNGRFIGLVEDNGCGFEYCNKREPDSSGGFGLFMLKIISDRIKGKLEIDSTPGEGTRIKLSCKIEGD